MTNDWKRIWSNRHLNKNIDITDPVKLFTELKRCNGFDTLGGRISDNALVEQYEKIKRRLTEGAPNKVKSVYEFGCGSGANLLMFERDGFTCGGIDYSEALINIAKTFLKTKDLTCSDAANALESPQYDCVLSNSVIAYFTDYDYARTVLEKMFNKTRYSIGLIDVFDAEKENAYVEYRRRTVENYDEKYADLPKLFYSKEFFVDFAKEHDLKIEFCESTVENYWNNDFIFNCFMYK